MAPETADIRLLLDALAREQTDLQSELRDLATDDWFRPTPARYWDVRDTVAHLADIGEVASDHFPLRVDIDLETPGVAPGLAGR